MFGCFVIKEKNSKKIAKPFRFTSTAILLMARFLHLLTGGSSHHLQGFGHSENKKLDFANQRMYAHILLVL